MLLNDFSYGINHVNLYPRIRIIFQRIPFLTFLQSMTSTASGERKAISAKRKANVGANRQQLTARKKMKSTIKKV